MRIALDFDGVLCDPGAVDPGRRMGHPVSGARDAIQTLTDHGHLIVVHTARLKIGQPATHVREWLEYFNMSGDVAAVYPKVQADVYIDDKALQFTNWPEIMDGLT